VKTISLGKIRGLQQCSTAEGAIAVLALDHRNNLRNALNPQSPTNVPDSDLIQFKQQVIAELSPVASAVLLDPEFGAAQCVASGVLPGRVGLLVASEATGYTGDPTARRGRILPGWSIAKVRKMGANAVKILAYYHPDSSAAAETEAFVRQAAEDCAEQDIPLFLEPLSYSLDPSQKKLTGAERRRVVVETARRLVVPGVDVLKAEFPLDISAEPDDRVWAEACSELTSASPAPWVLLSASVDFETFLRMLTVACQSGASGTAVGRAVWQEAPSLSGEQRLAFLREVARPRMQRVTALCSALARPWTQGYARPEVPSDWYSIYSGTVPVTQS
jgi:tagatose 1,6-diphosphate aldolase